MTSARRLARARAIPAPGAGLSDGIPAALVVGRCIEVWGTEPDDAMGAFSRWGRARSWWLKANDIERPDTLPIPTSGAPWSVSALDPHRAAERLAIAGATLDDLDHLRAQAQQLHARAVADDTRRE